MQFLTSKHAPSSRSSCRACSCGFPTDARQPSSWSVWRCLARGRPIGCSSDSTRSSVTGPVRTPTSTCRLGGAWVSASHCTATTVVLHTTDRHTMRKLQCAWFCVCACINRMDTIRILLLHISHIQNARVSQQRVLKKHLILWKREAICINVRRLNDIAIRIHTLELHHITWLVGSVLPANRHKWTHLA